MRQTVGLRPPGQDDYPIRDSLKEGFKLFG